MKELLIILLIVVLSKSIYDIWFEYSIDKELNKLKYRVYILEREIKDLKEWKAQFYLDAKLHLSQAYGKIVNDNVSYKEIVKRIFEDKEKEKET